MKVQNKNIEEKSVFCHKQITNVKLALSLAGSCTNSTAFFPF